MCSQKYGKGVDEVFEKRLNQLKQTMKNDKIDAIFLQSDINCYYFSGFSGSSRQIVISLNDSHFYTDFRYGDQAYEQVQNHEVSIAAQPIINSAIEQLKTYEPKVVGLEFSKVNTNDYLQLKESLPYAQFVNIDSDIANMRMIKDEVELTYFKRGMEIVDKTFTHILSYLKTGITENDLALELDYTMKKLGADGIKENHVIATGARASLPHGRATDKVIEHGDFVKMDFGAKVNGYYTDFTRTVIMGEASKKQIEIYNIVKEAQKAALQVIKPGAICSEIDHVARSIIADAGYGENFGHSLGHSLGLEIHESPSFRHTDNTALEKGMVITVEPGIYIKDFGGVRIEDLVVVTDEGIDNLTKSTKELQII